MSDVIQAGKGPGSLSTQLRVDQVCLCFEAAYKAGQQPRLEDYLSETPQPERWVLLRELLKVELAYRRRSGDQPAPEEYESRFPDCAELIHSVFIAVVPLAPPPGVIPETGPQAEPPDLVPSTATASETQTLHPLWIGKYRVVERLGSGGQAEVFRAVHPSLPGRDVVIKWAKQSVSGETQHLLITEGGIMARLDDPGLARIYDVDVHEGRPFVVMEYVAGCTLQQQIKQGLPSPREAAALVARLAHTLARVHKQGVYHRDLKPANILIDATGWPRLVDFGLALMDQPWDPAKRQEGDISGTFEYMAPEQANGQTDRIGARTDVFGLGAILYALLTGRPPYQAADRITVWEQARQGKVIPPRQINPQVPRSLECICLKALAREPEQRYASAEQLEAALHHYLRRRVLAAALTGTLLLCAAVLGLYFGLLRPPDRPGSSQPSAVLSGDLIVRVWTSGDESKRGLRVDELNSGALPVRNGEWVHLETQLNQPAYAYLLWVDGEGAVNALYPWNEDKIVLDVTAPAPDRGAGPVVHSPKQYTRGWRIEGKSGLETVLLLARKTPLPREVKLATVIGQLPPAPLRNPFEVVVRGFDSNQPLDAINIGLHRGITKEAEEIDDPLLQLMGRLRPHFDMIRAVRFAHRGE
jgi:serine/threonine protein kinase